MGWALEAFRVTTVVQIILYSAVLIRLFASSLSRHYRLFTVFIAFELVRAIVTGGLSVRSMLYGYLYFLTQPIAWMLHALVVLELFRIALSSHPGIATLGRRIVIGAVAISAGISVATLAITSRSSDSRYVILENYLVLERVINSSLMIFVLLLGVFLAYFPVPLSRNARLHAGLFGLYFLGRTSLWLLRNLLGPDFTDEMNLVMFAVVGCCLAAWALFLTPAGETQVVRSRPRFSPEDEHRLVAQLDALNRTLVGSAKK
jgi:hypothetical protein